MAQNSKSSLFEVSMDDVQSYEFKPFARVAENSGDVQDYVFSNLGGDRTELTPEKIEEIKFESAMAEEKKFTISPIVKQHRRINEQEKLERERKVAEDVQKRVNKIREKAIEEGYQAGLEKGRQEVKESLQAEVDAKLDFLQGLLTDVMENQKELVKQQKLQIYDFVKTLSKWVILKELKDDQGFYERLLEKLIAEIGTKSNLHIQVGAKTFEGMEDVLARIEEKIGKLHNVRVEIGRDQDLVGLNIESENAIVVGDLNQQFANIDKIFESIGLIENGE